MGGDTACVSGRAAGGVEADLRVQEVEEDHTDRGTETEFFALRCARLWLQIGRGAKRKPGSHRQERTRTLEEPLHEERDIGVVRLSEQALTLSPFSVHTQRRSLSQNLKR